MTTEEISWKDIRVVRDSYTKAFKLIIFIPGDGEFCIILPFAHRLSVVSKDEADKKTDTE